MPTAFSTKTESKKSFKYLGKSVIININKYKDFQKFHRLTYIFKQCPHINL